MFVYARSLVTRLVASGDTGPRRSKPTMSKGCAIHRGNGLRRGVVLFRHRYGCCDRLSVKVALPPLSLAHDHGSWDPPDHGIRGSCRAMPRLLEPRSALARA